MESNSGDAQENNVADFFADTRAKLADTHARIDRLVEKKNEQIQDGNRRVAKNRIALFVIKTFALSIVLVLVFIMAGALWTESGAWEKAYPPMFDILQKVFLPVVTLAFGFYNSDKEK